MKVLSIARHFAFSVAVFSSAIISGEALHAANVNLPSPVGIPHYEAISPNGSPPVGVGCAIDAGSTDTDGSCVASSSSGSITFASTYGVAPSCMLVDASATSTVSMPVYTVSATAITLSTIISTHKLFWHCAGKTGSL